jgi:hypothetical protein
VAAGLGEGDAVADRPQQPAQWLGCVRGSRKGATERRKDRHEQVAPFGWRRGLPGVTSVCVDGIERRASAVRRLGCGQPLLGQVDPGGRKPVRRG